MTITNGTTNVTIPSRFLTYQPGYNELSRTPTRYDNSVLYLDASENGGGIAIIEEQSLVDNSTVRLTLLQNKFQRGGTGQVNIELYPTSSGSTEKFPTGSLNITLPTQINGSEYWDGAISDESVYNGVKHDHYAKDVHALTLQANSSNVRVNTVGIQTEPNEGGAKANIRPPTVADPPGSDPEPDPQISMRIDDITDRRSNNPEFYVSYDFSGQADTVEVSASSTSSTASDSVMSSNTRGGVSLAPTFGDGQEFAVTVRAIDGGTTVAQRTIFTFADTQNPSGNDDLSRSGSASIQTLDIEDRSNPNPNKVRYRFTYDTSSSGSFSEIRLYALNRNGNGPSSSTARNQRSANNVDVNPSGGGTNEPYKVAVLVLDIDGVVVYSRIVNDPADGTNPS
ncbi:PKD domain-containing protein [Halorubrum sp. ASP121]|nr:PKD domain-containing protein [Halorubrum sp. ASP121]